jgi:hypothetical protein
MTDEIRLAVACLIVSAIGVQWAWSKARVLLLRQRLFAVRDSLYDAAFALGEHENPAHQDVRARLNALIRYAHRLSLPSLALLSGGNVAGPPLAGCSEELAHHIRNAQHQYASAIATYVIWWRFGSGILLMLPLAVIGKFISACRDASKSVRRMMKRGFTDGIEEMTSVIQPAKMDAAFATSPAGAIWRHNWRQPV